MDNNTINRDEEIKPLKEDIVSLLKRHNVYNPNESPFITAIRYLNHKRQITGD